VKKKNGGTQYVSSETFGVGVLCF